ncbi:unnamed protein product [Parascedosporium putredinis]|uniref:Uncharacterized protein n=1 Tax=Parascedosporium putredinis TaxID=1442378 RepID=A0A9P1GXW4_9PEZI|nr:unnamed protein product [Parascedosporium putredinis]CAI7989373.1 unnamed protein product [Parascedosporium putredinis]
MSVAHLDLAQSALPSWEAAVPGISDESIRQLQSHRPAPLVPQDISWHNIQDPDRFSSFLYRPAVQEAVFLLIHEEYHRLSMDDTALAYGRDLYWSRHKAARVLRFFATLDREREAAGLSPLGSLHETATRWIEVLLYHVCRGIDWTWESFSGFAGLPEPAEDPFWTTYRQSVAYDSFRLGDAIANIRGCTRRVLRTHSLTAFRIFANCAEVQDAIYSLIHEDETSTYPKYPAAEAVAQCFEILERERVAREMLSFRNSHFVTTLVYTYIGPGTKATNEIWVAFAASPWYKGPKWDEALRNLTVASSVEVFEIGRYLHTVVEDGDDWFISQYSRMGLIK